MRNRQDCPRCKGAGEIQYYKVSDGSKTEVRECGYCNGTGFDESAEALADENN